ncbi:maleylpyruvate isomerase N-terminal domain-containing protein [Streptomyces sp. NPDC051218]|uniref:maleylpyruvate isomerase N-terminal domain-containing protein n=1 Tax=Streptomyces sp. NPDC051218 TaxID=3365645 RepID=UPI0037BDB4C7
MQDTPKVKEKLVGAVADAAEVLDRVVRLVESLDERESSASTPCEAWDVRAVVDHLLDVQQRFLANLTGEAIQTNSTLRENAAMPTTAFQEQGALDRVVPDRLGDITGLTLLDVMVMEHLAHGWTSGRRWGATRRSTTRWRLGPSTSPR